MNAAGKKFTKFAGSGAGVPWAGAWKINGAGGCTVEKAARETYA